MTYTAARPWPAHREDRGFLRVRHTLEDPTEAATQAHSGLSALCSIHHSTLTILVEATPGDGASTRLAARMPVERVVVSILAGHHSLFTLSSQGSDRADEVYCYARDQRTRNRWIAIFRRLGLAIYTQRQNGSFGRVLEPIFEMQDQSQQRERHHQSMRRGK